MSADKREALIIIPSGGDLPLSEPVGGVSVSIGFFLVELAEILRRWTRPHDQFPRRPVARRDPPPRP
jgi:hypothetical protein